MDAEDQIAAFEAKINRFLPEPLYARISDSDHFPGSVDIRVNLLVGYRRMESLAVVERGVDIVPAVSRHVVHNIYTELLAQARELEKWMANED